MLFLRRASSLLVIVKDKSFSNFLVMRTTFSFTVWKKRKSLCFTQILKLAISKENNSRILVGKSHWCMYFCSGNRGKGETERLARLMMIRSPAGWRCWRKTSVGTSMTEWQYSALLGSTTSPSLVLAGLCVCVCVLVVLFVCFKKSQNTTVFR